ncbi:DUF4040 domain-containing protein [Thiocapsa rosea]|uniref:Multisubunit sodium/proton antiporter MrpB subunit n=1 Tax=Thiocapsa rosea TaxID=69360 RepID=A0A495V4T7_9GAMM|nr:DUF4040 domain-containing protein [Thiocapsa rosea]RKT43347.1 multisubunit sodium/proton antiporter MrpB subunit [Thiocapsa rosea]
MLVATAIAVLRMRSLYAVVMLFGIYSLLTAGIFVSLDAVDVAFTEAAVGAGISTVLLLVTLAVTGHQQVRRNHSPALPLTVVIITGAVLVWGTQDMPAFGDPQAPIHHHVADRYIKDSPSEVGMPNMVTSVLASYRGFDTLGETAVVFTAGVGVMVLLGLRRRRNTDPDGDTTAAPGRPARGPWWRLPRREPAATGVATADKDDIIRVIARLLVPFILLFALYVQFHGDFGPGGGFQAGVIFAAGIILYAITYGLGHAMRLIPPRVLMPLAALGVLLFGGVGIAGMLRGGNFLNYNVLAHDPVHGQHYGIMLIELGVGITVAAVMLALFYAFFSRLEEPPKSQ